MAVGIVRVQVNKRDLARLKKIEAVIPAMKKATLKVMRAEMKVVKNYMNMPASNWSQKNKPKWRTKDVSSTKTIALSLTTKSYPYIFIWRGTRTRRRIMSRDWVSKTKPGSLLAGPGRGKPMGFGIAPGIEARNWHERVFQIREAIFQRRLRAAIESSLRFAFPAGNRSSTRYVFE